jgi:hypothetical protein
MRKTPEADLQESVVAELKLRTVSPARFWFCPNGGNLSKVQSARFQRMGLTKGVPDLHFVWIEQTSQPTRFAELPVVRAFPRYGVIELKAGRGKATVEQQDFLADMAVIGHRYAVCNRADDVMQTLRRWGFPLR